MKRPMGAAATSAAAAAASVQEDSDSEDGDGDGEVHCRGFKGADAVLQVRGLLFAVCVRRKWGWGGVLCGNTAMPVCQ